MAINNPADLFLYELSGMYDGERKSGQLLSEMGGQLRDGEMTQMLQRQQQEAQEKISNLESCFRALGTSPRDIPCAAVDGMRAEFQTFASQQPSPEMMAMYGVGAALKLSEFGVGAYKSLMDKAMLMGETQCAQILQTNLVHKEESVGMLERVGHDMSQRMLASA
jgi:ferritin-like metal-binding protein YciE